ncbi:helix-turn-helix domain-containing protein [Agrobacterium deltaense]|uniref:helix-turn-helix domain-containing protein n=1 Tax=Rhizobium/Agrobacterium group TaxID=227290 RepID=UPI001A984E76|nr:helix-turn-helix domain-containing protein [Rhizobium sp. ZX09]QSZ56882.1 helix-turn-helix domain-containing protein [Rhizobium sp. ZX09]
MEDDRFAHLPVVMREIAEVAGLEAAWAIVQAQGGRVAYIPAKAAPGHWLPELVGMEAAAKICNFYKAGDSGYRILVPIAKDAAKRLRLVKALADGMSAPDAAAAAGMHVRSAFRARKRMKHSDDDQGSLF